MSKINIILNGTSFEIDRDVLSSASADLKSHLSSVMNGSGATIELGGTEYSIDSAKLSAATNAFISHLGTIAGEGSKVVIGGVEYSVDSTKLQGAIASLETGFGKLENPTPEEERLEGDGAEYYSLAPTVLSFRSTAPLNEFQEVQVNGQTVDPSNYTLEEGSTIVKLSIDYLKTLGAGNHEVSIVSQNKTVNGNFVVTVPELNEYNFYYNQPYAGHVDYFDQDWVFFLRESGVLELVVLTDGYMETCPYTIEGSNITVVNAAGDTFTGTFNENGLYCNEVATTFTVGGSEFIIADRDYVYLYNGDTDSYYVAMVIDKTKSSYGAIKTGINGKPTNYIGQGAFMECVNLQSITIPECIMVVMDSAFAYCSSLESITFENCAVAFNGLYVFQDTLIGWDRIIRKHIDRDDDGFCDICGENCCEHFDNDDNGFCDRCGLNICEHSNTELQNATNEYSGDVVCLKCGKIITKGRYIAGLFNVRDQLVVSWSDLVSEYGLDCQIDYSMSGDNSYKTTTTSLCYILTQNSQLSQGVKLVLPNNITAIGECALAGCTSLTSIEIPNSVTGISYAAFKNCTSLTSITIPDSVTSIGSYAFCDCSSLTSIEIPYGVTRIAYGTFDRCTKLTSITIPDSVTNIGDNAFRRCTSLIYNERDNVRYLGNENNPYLVLMEYKDTGITSYKVPRDTKVIGYRAFLGCTSLTSIEIPNSVTGISYDAFKNCTSLTSIEIPDSVTIIGSGAFEGCASLVSVTFDGTIVQWQTIEKGDRWNFSVPTSTYVQCSDGQVAF